MVVLVDEEDRENEGDLVFAADFVTPESDQLHGDARRAASSASRSPRSACRAAQPAADGRAQPLACTAPTSPCRSRPPKASPPASRPPTARAPCARRSRPTRKPDDIVQPGHIFPLMAQPGGVLVRAGHTEAGCDLARARRAHAGRGDLRDHERRRHDGAAARPRSVRARARPQDRHDRRPDPLSQPHRALVERIAERPLHDARTARSASSSIATSCPTRRTSRSCAARCRPTPRRWCACTSRCR